MGYKVIYLLRVKKNHADNPCIGYDFTPKKTSSLWGFLELWEAAMMYKL